jgi:hypothetical protein
LDPISPRYRGAIPVPAVLTGTVRSVHISRIFPSTDSYSVVAELGGQDAGLQDSAWVAFNSGSGVGLVRLGPTLWGTIFSASYFHAPDFPHLGTVVGRPFLFTARDGQGLMHETGPAYMWRVIEGVPGVLSPKADSANTPAQVDAHPDYVWEPFSSDFPFGYEVNVINMTEGFETTVWTSPLLGDTVLTMQQPDSLPLPAGDYYWTVTVEDSFENSSRSKQGMFTVAPERQDKP